MRNKKKITIYVTVCFVILAFAIIGAAWLIRKDVLNKHAGIDKSTISKLVEKFPDIFGEGDTPGLEAHRGLCDEYPENTVLSFEQAGMVDVYRGIETDVQMTKDGVFVCMHDDTIDRTTDGNGAISDYTYAELMEFWIDGGYGYSDEYKEQLKIPTLKEYLDICVRYDKIPYLELKLLSDEAIDNLIEFLDKEGFAGKCVLTSFSIKYLRRVSKLTDRYPLEYMSKTNTTQSLEHIFDKMSGIDNIIYRPNAILVDDELVKECNKEGLALECFGLEVGDAGRFRSLKTYGVLGVTCNSYRGLFEQ